MKCLSHTPAQQPLALRLAGSNRRLLSYRERVCHRGSGRLGGISPGLRAGWRFQIFRFSLFFRAVCQPHQQRHDAPQHDNHQEDQPHAEAGDG